jgi:hypothetical protein
MTETLNRAKKKLSLRELNLITLKHGAHIDRSNGLCVMELVAWVAGETHSDHPECVSPVIAAFLRSWNDSLPDDETRERLLRPLTAKVIGTAADDTTEDRRAWMAIDWLIRSFTPPWLRLAKLDAHAVAIESLPEIKDAKSVASAMPIIGIARSAAQAARDAAGDAAGDAAWAAAGAAAGAAARDAAWAAAWAAAGDAAGDAAWDAAWAAAGDAAGAALKPTIAELQRSAVGLIERMVAA